MEDSGHKHEPNIDIDRKCKLVGRETNLSDQNMDSWRSLVKRKNKLRGVYIAGHFLTPLISIS